MNATGSPTTGTVASELLIEIYQPSYSSGLQPHQQLELGPKSTRQFISSPINT